MLRQKEKISQKDFSNLLLSAKSSAQLAASIASKVSWRRLWDIALEKGVKGTKIVQSLFREVCRPVSCFKCSVCDSHVSSTTTCFEHVCDKHPEQVQKLSIESLVDMVSEGQADSVFFICAKLSNCKSLWELQFKQFTVCITSFLAICTYSIIYCVLQVLVVLISHMPSGLLS